MYFKRESGPTKQTRNHLSFKLCHLNTNILHVFVVLLSKFRKLRLELLVLVLSLLQICALVEEFSLQGIDMSMQTGLIPLYTCELLLQ